MNGNELLAKVREVSPATVRMMPTGSLEIQMAVNSFNEGHIFRYHLKPWSNDSLVKAIEACLMNIVKPRKINGTWNGSKIHLFMPQGSAGPDTGGFTRR